MEGRTDEPATPDTGTPAEPDPEVFRRWREDKLALLKRGEEELKHRVSFFLGDIAAEDPKVHVESDPDTRIKEAERIITKCAQRSIHDPEELLQPGCEKRGAMTFPLGDLLGVRVLVRSLADLKAIRRWAEDHPLGDASNMVIDDINEDPRSSGYRALHIDGTVTVEITDGPQTLPFEAQFKTLAQHVFGQHTHEDAYVRDELNSDPRFDVVRNLQRAMAESLNAADLMQTEIEILAERIKVEISDQPATEAITPASVISVVRALYGDVLAVGDAQTIARRAEGIGMRRSEELRASIDPAGHRGKEAHDFMTSALRRAPTAGEQISDILNRIRSEREEATPVEDEGTPG
jgi:ppGpp synthetase/RelA/SpoT-type nucleotidyltranferase